ncbi:MAG: type IV pilus assembly protein PilM [Polyangiaceae bacterium]
MSEGKNLIGVDIGSSAIKVCQLRDTRKGYALAKLGYAALPAQSIVDGHVMNAQIVVEAIQQALGSAKIKQREVAVSISGQAVIIRKITVPMMTAAELDEQIQWEAEQHIPFDIKDVRVDYEVLRRRPEAGQMDLLLVAAKRDQLDDYVQIAKQAKLKPIVVDIDAFTVQNVFEYTRGIPPDQTFAIINVGASLASINIISRGASAFTRDIANGGNYITEQIQKQLGVPFEQAEELKCATVTQGPGAVPQQVFPILEQRVRLDRRRDPALARLLPRDSGEARDYRIFLTGGSSVRLQAAVARRSRVPVEVIQPMGRITVEGKDVNAQLLQSRGSQLCVALGLAMRKDRERRS